MKTERVAREISGIPPGYQPIAVVGQVQLSVGLDPWLSLRALAGYCSLSRRTLQALLHDLRDPIPSYRVGSKLLVRRSEFDAWMQHRRASQRNLEKVIDATLQHFRSTTK